ncbi:MAG: high-potential iron-sulfur protein [Pseudomonadota bacterium]|nr:high-potential iron-sulfur protein [Pseudomonadota bacterium]
MKTALSRRGFLSAAALAAGAVCARPADPPHLDVTDPAARALGYVENAATVSRAKYPAFVAGSTCGNCLQLQGDAGGAYRPCGLFTGKLVAVAGWCSGWTAEM